MDFELSSDQKALIDAARSLASAYPDRYWREMDEHCTFPWDFYRSAAKAGWLSLTVPERFGGAGQGIFEASLVLEEIAASGAGMNGCSTLHLTMFCLNLIAKHGSTDLCEEILSAAVSGDLHLCFAVTEPDAGSDTSRIRTVATRRGEDYVITGRKVWITKADIADHAVLLARTSDRADGARPTDGLSLFIVEMSSPGIQVSPIPKMGRNAVASCDVTLDDVVVPSGRRIGEEGRGFTYLLNGINPERIMLAHEAIGIGRAALTRAVRYANERVVFGRPIGKNQGIAFPLAEAHAQLNAARLMARQAAWRYDRDLPVGEEANMAKWLCAEAGFFAADRALQTHGGMGYAREYDVERYFRESRLMRLAPVSQEMALNYISRHALGLPASY